MAALRSLEDDMNRWDGEVDRILRKGIRNKWDLEALRAAQDKLNQVRDALKKDAP